MGLLDLILLQGDDSRLYDRLVREKGYAGNIFGGINMLGNMFNYDGPMLWMGALIHDPSVEADTIMADVTDVIEGVRTEPVTQEELDRAMVKIRSNFYDIVSSSTRFGLVDLLAVFAMFDDNPGRINTIESEFLNITPELIQQTAEEYLRPTNRTVLEIIPTGGQDGQGGGQ